ncbi:molybdopterin converting factor subunit 1 [Undibacterium fentianense]|uniref:Molybdopterin converting factor subunit 1 n=1 Tax=Undibacterium fentianense TaxID=2828728 RepID=A0A941E072_9BURK|nr:molybdopterin converting factor subunit 1 [Undibacterium fentianense]MBR7800020.1 molybdopterin converting factor subunit 1 [Undibacterium fentianense]
MKIQLRFFASVREQLNCSAELVELPKSVQTAYEVREFLIGRGELWAGVFASNRSIRMAYNQQMLSADVQLQDGGELAFFPPVTGG